jgi:hypothetical protein
MGCLIALIVTYFAFQNKDAISNAISNFDIEKNINKLFHWAEQKIQNTCMSVA